MSDLISRQAAIDALESIGSLDTEADREYAKSVFEALPPATPQPKTGYWIRWYEQKEYDCGIDNIPHCKCSECGKEYDPHSSQFIKYCCECGAKMTEISDQKCPYCGANWNMTIQRSKLLQKWGNIPITCSKCHHIFNVWFEDDRNNYVCTPIL